MVETHVYELLKCGQIRPVYTKMMKPSELNKLYEDLLYNRKNPHMWQNPGEWSINLVHDSLKGE